MFRDRSERLISYHDTWISLDPLIGCPYQCVYCVLRHAGSTGLRPKVTISAKECLQALLKYPLFRRDKTPVAIGNETDIFHPLNVNYLIELLTEMSLAGIRNPIVLVTKAPLSDSVMRRVKAIQGLIIVMFLSYSGLGRQFEPNFTDDQLRRNFSVAKESGFLVIHYWRPLLPQNTTVAEIRRMLSFASSVANATVFVGLKLHPELTRVITAEGILAVPEELQDRHGEWIDADTVKRIYLEAAQVCPDYRLYRHSSCALAAVLQQPNHTATIFRQDICAPSHCPEAQRSICESARRIPGEAEIVQALSVVGRDLHFERRFDRIVIHAAISQEEFAFLLHSLNCPLEVRLVKMQNLYYGSIYEHQPKTV